MKPLLMMKTRGISGTFFNRHAGMFKGLSRSAGIYRWLMRPQPKDLTNDAGEQLTNESGEKLTV